MLTPQEVSDRGFTKVSFGGGYNMIQVDEFLDVLTKDYSTLYSENTALKRKMKVMQDKIDEYRTTEETMRKALSAAQQMADNIVKDGKTQKDRMLEEAHYEIGSLRKTTEDERKLEEGRLQAVKQMTTQYVEQVKELHRKELEYLDSLHTLVSGDLPMASSGGNVPMTEMQPPSQVVAQSMPQSIPQPAPMAPQQPMQAPVQPVMSQPVAPPVSQPMAPTRQIPEEAPIPQAAPSRVDSGSGMSDDVKMFLDRAMADALGEKKAAELTEENYGNMQQFYGGTEENYTPPESIEATTRFLLRGELENAQKPPAQVAEDSEYDAEIARSGSRLDFSRLQQEFGQQNHNHNNR